MAALLEIAESEFLALRKLQSDYTRAIAVQVEAKVPDLPVDAVSLRTFIETDSTLAEIDKQIADSWGATLEAAVPDSNPEPLSKAANAAGVISLQQLRDSLKEYAGLIPEYAGRGHQQTGASRPKNWPVSRGTGAGWTFFAHPGLTPWAKFVSRLHTIVLTHGQKKSGPTLCNGGKG